MQVSTMTVKRTTKKDAPRMTENVKAEEGRRTKKASASWKEKEESGCFVGEKMVVKSGKRILAFIHVEKPENFGQQYNEKTIVNVNITFFDGILASIKGKEMNIPFVFNRRDFVLNNNHSAKEQECQARKELEKCIARSMEKINTSPWVGQDKRCENLIKFFEKVKFDQKLKRHLREFALYETIVFYSC